MSMRISFSLALIVTALASTQAASQGADPKSKAGLASQVVLASDVVWRPLNPARGDKGPKAGTLWGDQTGPGPSGFLVRFADGFSSPPHIHNITYRAVVISGLIHNDDPDAEAMWLPTGSFWTQPKGAVHITAAKGSNNLAYVEIEEGPYRVLPPEKAFDTDEVPVNLDESNIVWLDASDLTWVDQPGTSPPADSPKMAFFWGSPQESQLSGSLVTLPPGFTGQLRSNGSTLRAVVIRGQPSHQMSRDTDAKTLKPGSYFGAKAESAHRVSCEAEEECILYVRTRGKFDVIPAQPEK